MSVAFRRESDEEHLEPRFELPLPPGPNLVTARGLRLIEARVAALAAAAAATEKEDERQTIARDLRYWQTRRATAELTPPHRGDEAGFGKQIIIRLNGQRRELMIVGHDEADPASGRLAFTAPLARALMGSEPGDLIAFAGREDAIELLAVADIPDDHG